jgi:hypothetical protein
MITAAVYTTEAEMRSAYRAARPAVPVKERHLPPPRLVEVKPDADQHVQAWRQWSRLYSLVVMPSEFVRLWCRIEGIDHALLLSPKRTRVLCRARTALAQALVSRYPRLSTTKIGQLLNREHTSVLYFMGRTKRAKEHAARQALKGK